VRQALRPGGRFVGEFGGFGNVAAIVTALLAVLQRRGIESRFLFFPDENHWILRPANSLQWHREVIGWLDGHLRK